MDALLALVAGRRSRRSDVAEAAAAPAAAVSGAVAGHVAEAAAAPAAAVSGAVATAAALGLAGGLEKRKALRRLRRRELKAGLREPMRREDSIRLAQAQALLSRSRSAQSRRKQRDVTSGSAVLAETWNEDIAIKAQEQVNERCELKARIKGGNGGP